jgi:outer membrane lipoprotein-sorting protein
VTVLVLSALLAADAAAVLKQLEDAGRGLTTMKARFHETKVLVLLDEKSEAKGTVLLQVPGRFRWNYESPQESVTLVKDGRFSRYLPRAKQVFRGQAKGEADLLVGFGPGAAGLGKKYQVTLAGEEAVAGAPAFILDLKPQASQAASALFTGIRLWVDKARHIPVQTQLTEPTGDYTVVRFEGVELNGRLPPGAFDLALPKDVVEVK